jgi:hypothetical protein
MDERFEKFITEHRDKFDFREPDPRIWKKIEADIRVKKGIDWRLVLSRAAAVVIIFAASYAVNEFIHRQRSEGFKTKSAKILEKEIAIPGLKETEAYYTSLVNQKLDELKPIIANCPVLEEELNYDMSELDSVYHDLKNDLKDNIANQEVIEAIIENYRLRINILEDILTEINPQGEECISKSDDYAI